MMNKRKESWPSVTCILSECKNGFITIFVYSKPPKENKSILFLCANLSFELMHSTYYRIENPIKRSQCISQDKIK